MARLLEAGLCLALALVPLAQVPGKGKDPKKKEPPKAGAPAAAVARLELFAGKLAEARKRARERNAGLLIHILLKDMEAENKDYVSKILENPELVAACARVVVYVAHNGEHAPKTVEDLLDGKKITRQVCSFLPWFESCAQHAQAFNDLALEFREEDGSLHCPQTILLAPDGTIATRLNTLGVPAASEVLAGVEDLVRKFGPGLTEAEWTEVARVLDEARGAALAKNWPLALQKWARILALTPKSAYGTEATQGSAAAEKELVAELDRTCAELVPGKAAAAWKRLSELQTACTGLALEKEIAARLKKAETKKEIQPELAAVKLEAEAEALLQAAQAQADARKEKELEKTVRKLLGKRYAATEAARRARSLWPQWAPPEEPKPAGG